MPTVYSPPVSTYVPLATITLASTDSEVEFSSIPATYRDLVLVFSGTTSSNAAYSITFNNNESDYSRVLMLGNSSGAISLSGPDPTFFEAGTTRSTSILQIMDYAQTDKHKTVLTRSNIGGSVVAAFAGRWGNTSAITSFKLFRAGQTFGIGSTFSLYGIAA
jgi:hypothetical protein